MPEKDRNITPPKYWTTLAEYYGDPEVARLRREEFFEKPARFFDELEIARATGKRPDAFSEAAGFAERVVENHGGTQAGLSRRDFLKLSTAAAAFAAAGCALRPTEKIIPYVKAPADFIPGVANYYATTMSGAAGTGVLVKTREGKPVKIEGNPDHPLSQGKLSAAGQYSIFDLYDPDRLQNPVRIIKGERPRTEAVSWQTADEEIGKALAAAKGKIVLLTGTLHGKAKTKLVADFIRTFPNAQHVVYDAWNYDSARDAAKYCYGWSSLPRYHFDRADYFLFFECDPLGTGYGTLEWSVDFGKTRNVENSKFSKVVALESYLSLTGSSADERIRIQPNASASIATAIAGELIRQGHFPPMPPKKDGKKGELMDPAPLRETFGRYPAKSAENEANLPAGTIARLARDLWDHRGKGIVMGGDDYSLQVAVNLINAICGNDGHTIDGTVSPSRQAQGSSDKMRMLLSDMENGKVDVLIVHGTNPAFYLPPSRDFSEKLEKVKLVVSLSGRVDETARLANFVLPTLHWLESWDDAEPHRGLHSLTQPVIHPLYDNRAWQNSLLQFARAAKVPGLGDFNGDWLEYIKEAWKNRIYLMPVKVSSDEEEQDDAASTEVGDEPKDTGKPEKRSKPPAVKYVPRFPVPFEQFWTNTLRDGVVSLVPKRESYTRAIYPTISRTFVPAERPKGDQFQAVVYPSPILNDGAHANNAWLLECPDSVSRIAWTNYASISPATADKLGIAEGDILRLEVEGAFVEIPAHVQPGDSDDVVSVQAGWGRTHAGKIGNEVGANAFALRATQDKRLTSSVIPCRIKPTGKREQLPCVQGHNYIEGRPIIAETSLEEYTLNPKAGHPHEHELMSLWPPHEYKGNRWGMVIDLSKCIGCNACLAACQVENNIPVVGRDDVERGRELHWIRIDRYYSGEPENPEVTFQPMLCQHCENAPCETVCPVLATVHNEEGLNQQIYNRCVGTRYCSNNCPYKVRRFNWHEYALAAYDQHPLRLVLNPDVTVREKGVMEKCTFCVHRIREGKLKAKMSGRPVSDEDVLTACQQTCPTNAITFGNLNDPESRAAKELQDERSYRVLELLNVKPSVSYWTKLRNRPPRTDTEHHDGEGHHA